MGLLDGLLGSSFDDPKTAAALTLAQGLLSSPRALQGLSGGLLGYQQSMAQSKQQAAIEKFREAQLASLALQNQQAQRQAQQGDLDRTLTQRAFSPVTGIEANRASGITGPRPAALGAVGQLPKFDASQFIAAGGSPDRAFALQTAMTKQQAKIKDYKEVRMPDGSVQIVGFDEYGKPVDTGRAPFKAEEVRDFGGFVGGIDPITGQARKIGNKTMTPGEIAADARSRERLNFDRTQAQGAVSWQQDAEGNFVALPTRLSGNGPVRGVAAISPGAGMLPLQGKGAGMTEDQAKATGWLVQAENAFKNMKAAGFDKDGKPTGAAYPGPVDALEKIGISGPTNWFRSKDRQAFMQSASSLSEALLRAATGAGVNKDEAAQKVQELTPRFGEEEEVTQQKMAAIPLYIESLKVRSGPGAKRVQGIQGLTMPASAPIPGLKFLGFEGQ